MTSPKPLTAREFWLREIQGIQDGDELPDELPEFDRLGVFVAMEAYAAALSAGQERAEPPTLDVDRAQLRTWLESELRLAPGDGMMQDALEILDAYEKLAAQARINRAIWEDGKPDTRLLSQALNDLHEDARRYGKEVGVGAPQSELREAAQDVVALYARGHNIDNAIQAIRRALSQSELRETEPPTLEEFQAKVEEAVKLLRREGRDSE